MMRRLLYLSPLIVATIICVYLTKSYIDGKAQREAEAARFALLKRGMTSQEYFSNESLNRRTMKKFSLTVRQGISQVSEQIGLASEQRQRIMEQVKQQKQLMEDQRRMAENIKSMIAENNSMGVNIDLMRIQDLVRAMDHQTELIEANQQKLVNASQQIQQDALRVRSEMNNFIDTAQESTQQQINDRMEALRNQSGAMLQGQEQFMQNAKDYMESAHDKTQGIAQQLLDTNNYLNDMKFPSDSDVKEQISSLLDKQHSLMENIRANSEKIEQQRQDLKQRMQEYRFKINDLMQSNAAKVQEAQQKAEEINRMNKEKIADQMMRIREQRMDQQR